MISEEKHKFFTDAAFLSSAIWDNKVEIVDWASFNSIWRADKLRFDVESEALAGVVVAAKPLGLPTTTLSFLITGTIGDAVAVVIVFPAPADPADNNPPKEWGKEHFILCFRTKESGTDVYWVMKSMEESAGSLVGTEFIKNLSFFLGSDNKPTTQNRKDK